MSKDSRDHEDAPGGEMSGIEVGDEDTGAEEDDAEEGPPSLDDDLGSEVEVDADAEIDDDEIDDDDLLGGLSIDTTDDIKAPDRLIDQVIGQEHARDIVMKAAKQHRHVMMIGSPGTGKSMLAKAMTELLPKEELQDVLVYHNPDDDNEPKVRTVPAGKGEQIVDAHKEEAQKRDQMRSFLMWIIIAVVVGYALLIAGDILIGILAAGVIYLAFRYGSRGSDAMVPNLLIDTSERTTAPFEDATGAHAGALLGDVRHAQGPQGRAVHRRDQHPGHPVPAEADDGDPGGGVLHHRPVGALLGGDGPDRARPV
jgi:Lon-like ATP-dependent protease